jgi:hypothetical protein
MNTRNFFLPAVASIMLSAPVVQASETATVDIVSIRGGGSYVELVTSKAVCTTGGVSPDWADHPRIEYGSSPQQAESVQALATAALLSGRALKIKASTSGSYCLIEAVWLPR